MDSNEIIIEPALRGEWGIFNPPGHPKLAYDFLAVNEKKSPYIKGSMAKHLFSFINVSETCAWSKPVFSPVDGEVIASHDGETDRTKISFIYDLFRLLINKPKEEDGFGAFGGNHVLIRFNDIYVLLCHLKMHSLTVKKGDKVTAGQKLGEVGNSGSSIQPHLHLQVMKDASYFPLFENLLPYKFTRSEVKEKESWVTEQNVSLTNGGHYYFGE